MEYIDEEFTATNGINYKILDPTEDALYKAYRSDLIDVICNSIDGYQDKSGKISMRMVLKILRSFKK